MNGTQKKGLSNEKRALIAAVLSLIVISAWTYFIAKQQPKPPIPTESAPAANVSAPPPSAVAAPPAPTSTAPITTPPRAETVERRIAVENGLYRVEFSNRGAIVRSWQLKQYRDDAKPPQTLDLVHRDIAGKLAAWPFSLALDDPQLESAANSALYQITPGEGTLQAPAQIAFEWSDGHLSVTKRLKFDRSYVVAIETQVTQDGKPLAHSLAWRGGFGDSTVYLPADKVQIFSSAAGKLDARPHPKLNVAVQPAQRNHLPTALDFAGIEDQYFAAAFIPPRPGALLLTEWKQEIETQREGKLVKEPVAEMAAASVALNDEPMALRVYVGPKDLDELKQVKPPLNSLINFGWFEFVSAPLFYFLEWIHRYVPNYGWAIVVMTIVLNMLLFPLKVKSWRSMQKMQKVAPEIKSIQDRYKKYSLRDPRKQKMNEEVMAVYSREGVSPMGGCLPMALQMPIWFGLYRMLNVSIELRHAPWLGWIRDLSARDPYYILPIIMAITMFITQKMTPATTPDPTQQRMMNMMPIMFGLMFVIFPVSSGLVLYILTSNLVGMGQQWYLNRHNPAPAPARPKKK